MARARPRSRGRCPPLCSRHAWTGDAPVLCHVADQEGRARRKRFAYAISRPATSRTWLSVPGAAPQLGQKHRLDRVDHQRRRTEGLRRLPEDLLRVGLGERGGTAGGADPEPIGAHLGLPERLLSPRRRAPGPPPRAARPPRGGASTSRLPGSPPSSTSEPGTTPPPRTRSSSPMPVSAGASSALASPRPPASPDGVAPPEAPHAGRRSSDRRRLLDQRVPPAAVRAAAEPLGGLESARTGQVKCVRGLAMSVPPRMPGAAAGQRPARFEQASGPVAGPSRPPFLKATSGKGPAPPKSSASVEGWARSQNRHDALRR
jgi:hypothetical protein